MCDYSTGGSRSRGAWCVSTLTALIWRNTATLLLVDGCRYPWKLRRLHGVSAPDDRQIGDTAPQGDSYGYPVPSAWRVGWRPGWCRACGAVARLAVRSRTRRDKQP